MRGIKGLKYLKPVRSRGHLYGYFDTGQKNAKGGRIYAACGRMDYPEFGAKYAAMLGHRTKRAQINSLLTVPAFVGIYQKGETYRKLAVSSKRVYDIYLKAFAEGFPTAPAAEVEQRDIVAMVDKRGDQPGAVNLMLGVIGSLYKWGRQRGHVANEPCKGIDPLEMGEHEPWPEWLVAEALACKDARVRLAVHLLYFTAQRIGDVCKMRWSQIADGSIEVRQQKTGKLLSLPLHRDLAAELATAPKRGMTIITRADAGKLNEVTLRRELQAWATGRGEKVVPHGLRKNAVNALLECGCSVAETAAISGQTLQLVEHYAKKRSQTKLAGAAILKWEKNG